MHLRYIGKVERTDGPDYFHTYAFNLKLFVVFKTGAKVE